MTRFSSLTKKLRAHLPHSSSDHVPERTEATAGTVEFSLLPPEVLTNLTGFLVDEDCFALSHASDFLSQALAAWHHWTPPIVVYDKAPRSKWFQSDPEAKAVLPALERSLRFTKRTGPVPIPRHVLTRTAQDPVSFEFWFALLPFNHTTCTNTIEEYPGGILLGSQMEMAPRPPLSGLHEQFAYVDPDRNLYCSMMRHKVVVKRQLTLSRWYHLSLSFDGHVERVYVNGAQVASQSRAQLINWADFTCTQLGSGCISGSCPGKRSPGFFGWYPFQGLIDDFRIYDHALTEEQMKALAGQHALATKPVYALRRDLEMDGGANGAKQVYCTRPHASYGIQRRRHRVRFWKHTAQASWSV